ncbi:hypothetical protein [Enterobacter kobei]|uniref:hypothetical protein n=1 Tax=Enterobacter kobei TaxID=208224 RepID=UPI002074E147|nr:hypothetical protein [Enterobacter kobei]MCM7576231.1 hypothetical protein [Enterobacter kobei]
MITFTKEQLIASAHARIEFAEMMLSGELEPLKERTWSIELELARIALASLEAEAVAFRSKLKPPYAGSERWDYTDHRQPDAFELENCFIERLFTVPPAPVSVPSGYSDFEEIWSSSTHPLTQDDEMKDFAWDIWNACRATMLKSFGNSEQLNSPVIQGCSCLTCRPVTFSDSRFVVCPECGNKRCPHANDHRNACTGSNEPGQEGSAYPAAPRQEVKP